MQDFTVDFNGKAKTRMVNRDVNWGNDSHFIFGDGGTALVIHAKADDMKTDPAGNAGDRIACGVITKQWGIQHRHCTQNRAVSANAGSR